MADVTAFGARGDPRHDDTRAIQRAVDENEGVLVFPHGTYRITRPIEIELKTRGRTAISGSHGCARLMMAGPGPALSLNGAHKGAANPETLTNAVIERESMPVVSDIEIVGAHPQADGIRLEKLWQPHVIQVYIHDCRHGVHVVEHNRNLIISSCHIHNNRVGVFYDRVDLHQSNVCDNHISYNKAGGIKVLGSEIRNLQITGNDIEYNYDPDAEESADIWIETLDGRIREGTIIGNTIQAMPSPGGANVRFRGLGPNNREHVGNWGVSGNLISSQNVNVHIQYARGIALSGNSFFSGHERNVVVEHSEVVAIGANTFDRHPGYQVQTGGGILFQACDGCSVTGSVIRGATSAEACWQAALEIRDSQRINISGTQILDCEPVGLGLFNSDKCLITGCSVCDHHSDRKEPHSILVKGGEDNLTINNLTIPCDFNDQTNRKK